MGMLVCSRSAALARVGGMATSTRPSGRPAAAGLSRRRGAGFPAVGRAAAHAGGRAALHVCAGLFSPTPHSRIPPEGARVTASMEAAEETLGGITWNMREPLSSARVVDDAGNEQPVPAAWWAVPLPALQPGDQVVVLYDLIEPEPILSNEIKGSTVRDFLTAIDEGLARHLPVSASTSEIVEEHVRAYPPSDQLALLAKYRAGDLSARDFLRLRDHTYWEGLAGEAYDAVNALWHYSLGS